MSSSVLIVGAGLSGLAAARELAAQGYEVTIVDKGRNIGGRLATCRFEGAAFDHGAQFFTVRDPRFRTQVENWQAHAVAAEWFRGYPSPEIEKPEDHYPRFHGTPGMTSLAKSMAEGMSVRLNEKLLHVRRDSGRWTARSESGDEFQADWLVLTPPAEQSLALLNASGVNVPEEVRHPLENLNYEPCFALMVLLDGPSRIPPPGALYVNGEVISWLADNHQKGVSPVPGAVTIHASGAWTQAHYDAPPEEVASALLAAASEFLGQTVVNWRLHRWRYSKPENPLDVGALAVPELKLVFAGDALNGAKVEGAVLSGWKAAELIMEAGNVG
jgi:hypothetical protein